ncbi:hypothetical protein C8Q77DRAFT_742213 [Trametes polyzona]|nr:hypothetical protein C8Q77DRAFT_742213 [Trametes polyzona]
MSRRNHLPPRQSPRVKLDVCEVKVAHLHVNMSRSLLRLPTDLDAVSRSDVRPDLEHGSGSNMYKTATSRHLNESLQLSSSPIFPVLSRAVATQRPTLLARIATRPQSRGSPRRLNSSTQDVRKAVGGSTDMAAGASPLALDQHGMRSPPPGHRASPSYGHDNVFPVAHLFSTTGLVTVAAHSMTASQSKKSCFGPVSVVGLDLWHFGA